jgi:hypothetical protein
MIFLFSLLRSGMRHEAHGAMTGGPSDERDAEESPLYFSEVLLTFTGLNNSPTIYNT